ncbi:unnamed protein product, partial [Ectocarpus sp. 12 AP-2014]
MLVVTDMGERDGVQGAAGGADAGSQQTLQLAGVPRSQEATGVQPPAILKSTRGRPKRERILLFSLPCKGENSNRCPNPPTW